MVLIGPVAPAQKAPRAPDAVWKPPASDATLHINVQSGALDAEHVYALPELIDLAQMANPQTRVAWQEAKIRAGELGIARSELFPTLVAVATANTIRQGVLINSTFVRQTVGVFAPVVSANYLIFDFGARAARIASARDQLIAADFAFNAVQLSLLFETARRYYRLLDAQGQQESAAVNLTNAQQVQAAVEARLHNGLATLPDALEAQAAAAQADYELQAAIGQVEIARGDLLSILAAPPFAPLRVQPLDELHVPDQVEEGPREAIERALQQRPDLAQRVAERRAAEAGVREARSAYLPTLSFQGTGGEVRAYGQQDLLPGVYAGPAETWNASLTLSWTLFDGGRREATLARAHAEDRRAQAAIEAERNDIEEEVWVAYSELQTALRQRQAATSLLIAARSSYQASLKSYQFGLRNTVDVVTAQRTLAQALSQDVAARTNVLTQLSALAYRTADLLKRQKTKTP